MVPYKHDITKYKRGDKQGHLVIVGVVSAQKYGQTRTLIEAKCSWCKSSRSVFYIVSEWVRRHPTHCGCLRGPRSGAARRRYKDLDTRIEPYKSLLTKWRNMIAACDDVSSSSYPTVGARQIPYATIFRSFRVFCRWALDVGYEPGMYLRRKDVALGFIPRNLEFVWDKPTYWQQSGAIVKQYDYKGHSYTIEQLSLHTDCIVSARVLRKRLYDGWDVPRALSTKKQKRPQDKHEKET